MNTSETLLTIEAVAYITGVSKSTIRRLTVDPASGFPEPLRVAPNCVRWHPEEIRNWLNSLRRHDSAG